MEKGNRDPRRAGDAAEYRRQLWNRMSISMLKYEIRKMQNEKRPEEEISRKREELKQTESNPKSYGKTEIVSPAMAKIPERRTCVKYGSFMSGSVRVRWFVFDPRAYKFRYFRDEKQTVDVEDKAMDLSKCQASIEDKATGSKSEFKWEDPTLKFNYRLLLKFEERKLRPIFFYSNNVEELYTLKNYILFTILNKRNLKFEGKSSSLKGNLEQFLDMMQLLYSLKFSKGFGIIWKIMNERTKDFRQVAIPIESSCLMIRQHISNIKRQYAKSLAARVKHLKPTATIRLNAFLLTLARMIKPSEELIVEAAGKIKNAFEDHKMQRNNYLNEEIEERIQKSETGFSGTLDYRISPIVKNRGDRKDLKIEDSSFESFDFPLNNIKEKYGLVRITSEQVELLSGDSILGKCQLGDISSLILNDNPEGERRMKWLKINGRKQLKQLALEDEIYGKEESVDYIDPSSYFLAPSIDSYFSKKRLLEIKIFVAKINDTSELQKEFALGDLAFRIKISVGSYFYITSAYQLPKIRENRLSLEFSETYCIRENEKVSEAVIALCCCATESKAIKDEFQTLKQEKVLGFTRIRFDTIPNTKKLIWVPLNSSVCFENPIMELTQPLLSVNFRTLKDVPGNAPETPLCGKGFYINDMVYYYEKKPLEYPENEAQFMLLGREDIRFSSAKVKIAPCPLRIPMNEEECRIANLGVAYDQSHGMISDLLKIKNKVPFMFKMPGEEDSEEIKNNLPVRYDLLKNKYQPGEIVKELTSYETKNIGILKAINSDCICFICPLSEQSNPNPKILQKDLREVFPIQEEGICIFNKMKYCPKPIDHDWTLSIGFENEETREFFIKNLKEAIRDKNYKQKAKIKGNKFTKKDIPTPIIGELKVYITEGRNIGIENFRNFLKESPGRRAVSDLLYVNIGFRSPRYLAELFTSVYVGDTFVRELDNILHQEDQVEHKLHDNPIWRSAENPAGEMKSMRNIAQIPKSNTLLSISVTAKYMEDEETKEYCFGTAEVSLTEVLDEQDPAHYYWLLLQTEIGAKLPQIKIWTLFISNENQVPFLNKDNPVLTYASHMFLQAQKTSVMLDSYKHPVNLGNYNPNYMRAEQDLIRSLKKATGLPEDEQIISRFLIDHVDSDKAAFEAWEYRLINSYRYLRQKSRSKIFNAMGQYLWDTYILTLMMNVTKQKTMSQYGAVEAERVGERLEREIKRARGSVLKLDRILFWKEAGSWKYSELLSLVKLGIPQELRASIWSELLGIIESKENTNQEHLQFKFYYYVNKSMAMDSVIFKQMENDVLEIRLERMTETSDDILLHNERAGVLKIAKAYYAWCLEENQKPIKEEKGKPLRLAKFGYFKGIMHLIQKIWHVFEETEAFWCIIGFAKALPYIFEMKDVLTGSLSWSQKMILLAISTVVEKKYPKIYRGIMKHGLPIEYYLADKVSTMLSTVYPTEVLLRFYDIIALEAASKEPIKAMWVLITGCIQLLVQNEVYIVHSRTADEIDLIINNTGINALQTQKLIEDIYNLSKDLFTSFNPNLEALLYVLIRKDTSVIGMEYAWTEKAKELDKRYSSVRELNTHILDLMKQLRSLSIEESKEECQIDSFWMNKFVQRFCRYYSENSKKEVVDRIFVYVYKIQNLGIKFLNVKLSYARYEEDRRIDSKGIIDHLIEFEGDPNANFVTITIGESYYCDIDIRQYENGITVTLDLPLLPQVGSKDEFRHKELKPQPFISLVIMVTTRESGLIDETYKFYKQSCMVDSKIIQFSTKEPLSRQVKDSVALMRSREKKLFDSAGVSVSFTPGLRSMIGLPMNSVSEQDKSAMRHLFSLIQSGSMVEYGDIRGTHPEIEALVESSYKIFAKLYDGQFPIKRLLVSLIATASLTVEEKLSHYYDIYCSFSGIGGKTFILEDLIELIQMLYELHLIYIPTEIIPHMVEQILTDGGINKITNAYLLSADVNTSEILERMNMRGEIPKLETQVVIVTSIIQESFEKYWKLWGHKHVFAGDPNSFCGKLSTVLDGNSKRPKNSGPYRLIICYVHQGHAFYKEYCYNAKEELILQVATPEHPMDSANELMVANRNNLSFVGHKIDMTKKQFIDRVKRLPMLTELMRMNISLDKKLIPKTPIPLTVRVLYKEEEKVEVTFKPGKERMCTPSQETPNLGAEGETDNQGMDCVFSGGVYRITLPQAFEEDLLVEIKTRILEAIEETLSRLMQRNSQMEIPDALNPKVYLNHSLQFFSESAPLEDYKRLENIRSREIILAARQPETQDHIVTHRDIFAFHTHGDYSVAWVKCLEMERVPDDRFLVKTALFPSLSTILSRRFILLDEK